MELYPLKSVPVFKSRIWGGQTLRDAFGKDLPAGEKIGESWEVADLPEGKSTIGNGSFEGQSLGEVFRRHTQELAGLPASSLGEQGKAFPLLIKFLDAQQVLSVQVHPDPETCRRMGKGDSKTECWYIIQARPGAVIYKGLKKGVTRDQFAKAIREGTAAELLAAVPVSVGECHFIPAGTAHAIGTGLLIAEVQTPSDTTYRVFDWNRVDESGKPRQLHIEEAMESIHFDITPDKLPVTKVGRLVDSDYFKVDKGHRAEGGELFLSRGVMRVLIFLSGDGTILSRQAEPVDFAAGDTLIIPAAFEGAVRFSDDTEYLIVTV
ncbi:MAG: type I phosphomannose isomerase catalytic subunit [Solirubrobacterales bacterium]